MVISGSPCRHQQQLRSGAASRVATATRQLATTPAPPPIVAARPAAAPALQAAPQPLGSAHTRPLPFRWPPPLRMASSSSSSTQVHI